jgi:hypothetical protein
VAVIIKGYINILSRTLKEGPSTRSQVAISNRWLTIQKAVNKFCGHFSFVERLDKSGKTEQDRVSQCALIILSSHPTICN